MTKRDKTLQQWETATQDRYETVHAVLTYYGFTLVSSGGSHRTYKHPALTAAFIGFKISNPALYEDFGPFGQLTISLKNGQYVKGRYLRHILTALDVVNGNSSS